MPKPHPYRPRRPRSGDAGDGSGAPDPGAGLAAEEAAAAEAAAEAAAVAEAASWGGGAEGSATLPPEALPDEPPGWFREEPLPDAPAAAVVAAAPLDAAATPAEHPVPVPVAEAELADESIVKPGDGEPVDGEFPGSPGTIYRTVPPLPEDAVARPRRRSRLVSILVGLVILGLVGAGGFGIGMLLPQLIPLPAGDSAVVSPAPSGAVPSVSPGASAGPSPAPSPSPSPLASVAPSPGATPRTYVVRRGDQLGRIAASFGITLQALQDANGITNPNLIFAGQKLVIPAPTASAAASSGASPAASPSAAP